MAESYMPIPEEAAFPPITFLAKVFFEPAVIEELTNHGALRQLDAIAHGMGFTDKQFRDYDAGSGRMLKILEFRIAAPDTAQSVLAVTGRTMVCLNDWFSQLATADQLEFEWFEVNYSSGPDMEQKREDLTVEANGFLLMLDTAIPDSPAES